MISGMDTAQVADLAARLADAAERVRALETRLTAGLEQAPWVGADRERFAGDWASTHRPGLRQVAGALDAGSDLATTQLREQERASG